MDRDHTAVDAADYLGVFLLLLYKAIGWDGIQNYSRAQEQGDTDCPASHKTEFQQHVGHSTRKFRSASSLRHTTHKYSKALISQQFAGCRILEKPSKIFFVKILFAAFISFFFFFTGKTASATLIPQIKTYRA